MTIGVIGEFDRKGGGSYHQPYWYPIGMFIGRFV
jgi:hypothetical protein